MVYILKKKGET